MKIRSFKEEMHDAELKFNREHPKHKQFSDKLKHYCENSKRFSIKPFLKKNSGIREFKKEDSIYVEGLCENAQRQCFVNVLKAWEEETISSIIAVGYMRENHSVFNEYEQHVLKFEEIGTEEQAYSLIERFLVLDIMFMRLEKDIENYKGYDTQVFIEDAGYNYEEIMERALISSEWKLTMSALHETCFYNLDEVCLYNTDKSLTEEKVNEYMEQLDRWNRIKDGKAKPNIEQKIIIGSTIMEELTNTKATQKQKSTDCSTQEREDYYLEQRSKVNPGFEFEQKEQEDGTVSLNLKFNEGSTLDTLRSTYHAITGSTNEGYARRILSQTVAAMIFDREKDNSVEEANILVNVLLEMAPKDIIDSNLCRRIFLLDQYITRFLGRAAQSNNIDTMDRCINNATKLSRLQNETIEARTRYLRQGEQKYTVTHQHVNVHGGKTVISGNLNHGGDNEKK